MLEVNKNKTLNGQAFEITTEDEEFPLSLKQIPDCPQKLYVVGNLNALKEGIAIVGARKATPYGISCAKHFASLAARQGIVVVSGGAYGCDSAAHRGAINAGGKTVVFLGGGVNQLYPPKNESLFQKIIDNNGAIVSEHDWDYPNLRHNFRARNRLIAGLSKSTLIVEAGLPSGTFSTADYALKYNREVLAVPGPITNDGSFGCNKLIYEGARPIINDTVFFDFLFDMYSCIKPLEYKNEIKNFNSKSHKNGNSGNPILEALLAQPMCVDELYEIASKKSHDKNPGVWLSEKLIDAERTGMVTKYSNGLYGPVVKD